MQKGDRGLKCKYVAPAPLLGQCHATLSQGGKRCAFLPISPIFDGNGPSPRALRQLNPHFGSTPSPQVKAAAAQVGELNWNGEGKKNLIAYYRGTIRDIVGPVASLQVASSALSDKSR